MLLSRSLLTGLCIVLASPAIVMARPNAREIFTLADKNQDNALSHSELKQQAHKFGLMFSDAKVSEIFASSDRNRNGSLDLGEFQDLIAPHQSTHKIR